jgi:hypothetical protein
VTVRGRVLWLACASALALLASAFLLGGQAESALTATCTDAQLIPRVAELSVSQGAPGYARLARGKETIVRAYLTTPTGCTLSSKQSIAPVSATVNVSYSTGDPPPAQTTQWCAAGTCSNYAPLAGRLAAATAIYSTSDPFFVIPDFYLAPNPANTASYNITFTFNLRYIRNGVTATTYTATSAVTKTVDQKTNALRVLVVPMGDPTSTSTQWSSAAETTLQNVITNAARAFPVPTGVTPALTTSATGGARYVVSTTLLDAKSLGLFKTSGNSTKFCASGANWNTSQVTDTSSPYLGHTLKADLLQRLADYNLNNAPPADLVLGVIDGAIAWKSTDGLGCDDGRAATPASKASGQIAWVRVSTDSYPTPLQMELMHPFGISRNASFHSANVEADGAGPGKGYNVLLRKVVDLATGALGTNDHSIMNYNTSTIPYTKDNTLVEPTDWTDALCDFGGIDSATVTPFQNCTLNSAPGTSQGVPAAGARKFFQISGILTSAAPGFRITMAKANQPNDIEVGVSCTRPLCGVTEPDSSLHLLLCSGPCSTPGNVQKDVGLAIFPDEGHADGGSIDTDTPDGFGALVEMNPTWTDATLTLTGGGTDSFSDSDADPNITSTSTGVPGTIMRSFFMPVAGNGRAIAFDGTYLYTTLASGSTVYKLDRTDGHQVDSFDVGQATGALAYNSGYLYGGAYDGTGNVYKFNLTDNTKASLFPFSDDSERSCLGGRSQIDGLEYRSVGDGQLAISGDACNTVFLKDLAGTTLSSFGTTNNSGITTDGAGGLWLALLTHGDTPYTELTHVTSSGAVLGDATILSDYAAEDLAYDSATFSPNCVVWTNQATFSFSAKPEIRAISVPCGDAAPSSSSKEVAVQATDTEFVSLFFTCGDPSNLTDNKPTFPLANGLRPNTDGEVIAAYTNQLFCAEGTPQIISEASNGWTSTGLGDTQAVASVAGRSTAPTVNIASPLDGAKYRRGEFIHYDGSATDAFDSAIVAGLKWYFDGTEISEGNGKMSFDKRLAADTPLGNHTIRLEATDSQGGSGHVASTTVTINIGPALCPSTSKCP